MGIQVYSLFCVKKVITGGGLSPSFFYLASSYGYTTTTVEIYALILEGMNVNLITSVSV